PLLERIDLSETAIIVTADHATPPRAKAHTGDPVPVAVYLPGVKPDGVLRFTEKECARGSLGVVEHGWELLPKFVEIARKHGLLK
ncbi:MAG: phosphonopyruvate decarboxylase, partial [Thermofilaceae archaeon]